MEKLLKITENKALIRFQDCDPFNHLNNSKYLDYFMNAREDQIAKHYNLNIYTYAQETGNSWVVGNHQIAYLRPALLMETITIDSQLFEYSDTNLYVELRMWNKEKTELKAVLWSMFTHYNLLSKKRVSHENKLMKLFGAIKHPVDTNNFHERIAVLKNL